MDKIWKEGVSNIVGVFMKKVSYKTSVKLYEALTNIIRYCKKVLF